ncbi:MAG: prolipoprotein diacylglyceryl transferase [Ruminococcaceae bacterium]|nr:prolipoprotein diacylglyceryl transferase [Oscillospiraceae bacterium]
MNTVSFPLLGLTFDINRVAFSIGNLTVYWYGILIALGFLLAMVYASCRAPQFGAKSDDVVEAAIWGIIGGMIGARTYFVIYKWEDFKDNLLSIFEIWNGGIAIYGGLIGGILAGFIVCKVRKVKFTAMLDLCSIGFLIGQGIGRWGNFMNVEAYGEPMTVNLPWGMTSEKILRELSNKGYAVTEGTLVHPCFLYESLWCLLGVLVLHLFSKHRRFDGEVALLYCVWYGSERFIVEGLRTDSLYWGSVRVSQALSAVLVVAAAIVWIVIRVKIHKAHDPLYLCPVGKLPTPTEEPSVPENEQEDDHGENY